MTDEEVRARLGILRRGDSFSVAVKTLNCLQMGAICIFVGSGTDLDPWLGYLALAGIPVSWLVAGIVRYRDSRSGVDVVRRRYERALEKHIAQSSRMKSFIGIQIGFAAVIAVPAIWVLVTGRGGLGAVLLIMNILFAVDGNHQWKEVLPRLERERAEYREGALP